MTDLVLARHGETRWHEDNRYAGVSDVDLTPRGWQQARALSRWAAAAGLAAVWSSPLIRARRTAAESAEATSIPMHLDDRLRELDFGAGEGLTAAQMEERFPEAREAFCRDPVVHHLPGGEDPVEACRLFVSCLDEIAVRHGDARVLVVAHTTAIRLALCSLLGIELSEYRRVFPTLGNCALTEIRIKPGTSRAALLQFNASIESRLM
jgi:probable phosphoglycerate mutase